MRGFGSSAGQLLLFARNFLRHPRMLGSAIPSSRFLVSRVLDGVDWSRARVIVEYGPGTGSFTSSILARMHADAILLAIEMNPDFVRYLRRTFPDPRLRVLSGSAGDVERLLAENGHRRADCVISGIPFSTMPPDVREDILRTTESILTPGGSFLVYQFSSRVRDDLERIFDRVDRGFVPLNILPARTFSCSHEGRRRREPPSPPAHSTSIHRGSTPRTHRNS